MGDFRFIGLLVAFAAIIDVVAFVHMRRRRRREAQAEIAQAQLALPLAVPQSAERQAAAVQRQPARAH